MARAVDVRPHRGVCGHTRDPRSGDAASGRPERRVSARRSSRHARSTERVLSLATRSRSDAVKDVERIVEEALVRMLAWSPHAQHTVSRLSTLNPCSAPPASRDTVHAWRHTRWETSRERRPTFLAIDDTPFGPRVALGQAGATTRSMERRHSTNFAPCARMHINRDGSSH